MRTRTPGILCDRSGERTVNKQYKGERIFARLGKVGQDDAESWLRARQAEFDARRENELREGSEQLFAAAAQKYLIECEQREVRTLDVIAYHVNLLLPYIGSLPMRDVCNETLDGFKEARAAEGAKNATINRSLEVVRTVANRAARVWRMRGRPWLSAAPLIEMLDEQQQRRPPYPITWSEQAELMEHLPAHLQRMALFALNCRAGRQRLQASVGVGARRAGVEAQCLRGPGQGVQGQAASRAGPERRGLEDRGVVPGGR